ncbi:MAG: translation initiation factor IF-3 [Candidatus Aureabacteria bacterium]|nr:translation initiation factor IF-3 [Candidatus Auribacterota bacterium]
MSNLKFRINREIPAKEIRVIADDGQQLGIISRDEAIRLAESKLLDLVEVNPTSVPPVCRIMDYGKFRYKQTKKEKEAKKKQHVVKVKEIKLRPQIEEHDYLVKLESAKKFLTKGNKVKVTLVYRGRELAHKEIGEEVHKKFCADIVETKLGAIESEAKMIGRTVLVVIGPLKH